MLGSARPYGIGFCAGTDNGTSSFVVVGDGYFTFCEVVPGSMQLRTSPGLFGKEVSSQALTCAATCGSALFVGTSTG